MTLLVFRDGVLAADTGCTRNDSREVFYKIRRIPKRLRTYFVAYAGDTDAIALHETMLREQANYIDPSQLPAMNCKGIVVEQDTATGMLRIYTFNQYEGATGRGVLVPEPRPEVFEGWDSAVTAAQAVAHVTDLSATSIISVVADINTAVQLPDGVEYVDFKMGEARLMGVNCHV